MAMKTNWTHKVVKIARDGQGKWFSFPTAATFTSETDALQYATDFAKQQGEAGVAGTKITVRARKGNLCVASIDVTEFRPAGAL